MGGLWIIRMHYMHIRNQQTQWEFYPSKKTQKWLTQEGSFLFWLTGLLAQKKYQRAGAWGNSRNLWLWKVEKGIFNGEEKQWSGICITKIINKGVPFEPGEIANWNVGMRNETQGFTNHLLNFTYNIHWTVSICFSLQNVKYFKEQMFYSLKCFNVRSSISHHWWMLD